MRRPLAVDLFTGLHGFAHGADAEGFYTIGVDLEDMSALLGEPKPKNFSLVIQDVRTLHGSQFKDAAFIWASPPCPEYSYMAMPFSRGRAIAAALRGKGEFPDGYTGSRTVEALNELFNACFRIQREASEAKGKHIPMVVENVKGAQHWVGRARWSFGSYYLWGDVPALMPYAERATKVGGMKWFPPDDPRHVRGQGFNTLADRKCREEDGRKVPGFRFDGSGRSFQTASVNEGLKGGGGAWFNDYKSRADKPSALLSMTSSKSSARIAKIPEPLARHIAKCYRP